MASNSEPNQEPPADKPFRDKDTKASHSLDEALAAAQAAEDDICIRTEPTNLATIVVRTGTSLSESLLDKEYRLKHDASEAQHKRWRSTILFGFTLVGLSVVFWLCFQILSNPQSSPDDKKWATALMTSIVSGSVGFVAGKAIS